MSVVCACLLVACSRAPNNASSGPPATEPRLPETTLPAPSAPERAPAIADAAPEPARFDPMRLHVETTEALRALAPLVHDDGGVTLLPAVFFEPRPGRWNQGNRAIAHHTIAKETCLEGLRGVTLQTDAQRAACRGKPNMVPVYAGGDARAAKACIDVFEFPNQACELPMVWGSPSQAQSICALEGKRLCTDKEWTLACGGDPEGKERWPYAYGKELDLDACNTNKPHAFGPDGRTWACTVRDAASTWSTCATDTEPSGAFPRCRSRFGVFDQHGNVAEEMTRLGEDGRVMTQLKGSAFFYVDVARKPNDPPSKPGQRETYPDHCQYDPRWHVEELKDSVHVNYHLGFRCCMSI